MTYETTSLTIDEAAAGAAVLDHVSSDGVAVVRLASAWSMTPLALRESAAASPFAFAARLLGVEPLLVERQPIRPVPDGRSFASTRLDTPLHTDSQLFLGAPAAVQVLICVEPAARGGESVLVDGGRLLGRLERDDLALVSALFEVDRVQRFYFGDVVGPTAAVRGGHLAWTCAPIGSLATHPDDRVAAALAQAVARERPLVHTLGAGEALACSMAVERSRATESSFAGSCGSSGPSAASRAITHGRVCSRRRRMRARWRACAPYSPSSGAYRRRRWRAMHA